jgi:hypothetical protein
MLMFTEADRGQPPKEELFDAGWGFFEQTFMGAKSPLAPAKVCLRVQLCM